MKTTKFQVVLISLILIIVFASCTNLIAKDNDSVSEPTNMCNMPEVDKTMGYDINLEPKDIEAIELGMSTLSELITKFGSPESIQPWNAQKSDSPICLYTYSKDGPVFWIAGNTVVGIEIRGSNFSAKDNYPVIPGMTFKEVVELYGSPELVTWSTLGSGVRTVYWDEGILTRVSLQQEVEGSLVGYVFYTESMTRLEFLDSFWTKAIALSPPTGDVVDAWKENPFD